MYKLTKLGNVGSVFTGTLNKVVWGYIQAELANAYEYEYEEGYLNALSGVAFNMLNKQNSNMVAEFLYDNIYEYTSGSELVSNLAITVGNTLNLVNLNTSTNVNLLINFIEQNYNVPNNERVFK